MPAIHESTASMTGSIAAMRVLVVDDQRMNQVLIQQILAKEGHDVETVDNGKQAVEALGVQVFDVVLMDVDMPEMDGLQATAMIRQREKSQGGHVPIIAVTSRSSAADRQRCLETGMDEHIAKPVHAKALMNAVDVTLGRLAMRRMPPTMRSTGDYRLNLATVLDRVGGDKKLLVELVQIFLEETPRYLQGIHASIAECNGPQLKYHAHTLRGGLGLFGADVASDAAQELEEMGSRGQFTGTEEKYRRLLEAVMTFESALRQLVV